MVTGQVVDTITNIKTVKLFAHAATRTSVAPGAMGLYRERHPFRRDLGAGSGWR
jgi:ATP-binding cassette, subfamily B, bacterial